MLKDFSSANISTSKWSMQLLALFMNWFYTSVHSHIQGRKMSDATLDTRTSIKVQYCGLSKYLDRMLFVWELIFWYFIDIWVIIRMIISRNHFYHNVHVKYQTIIIIWDYHDSCSIIFSCKFCNCRHQIFNLKKC